MNKDTFHILSAIYTLGFRIPYLALICRRLHDTGRSGWNILLSLIPVIGEIILPISLLQDSQPGDNQYGANPKEGINIR